MRKLLPLLLLAALAWSEVGAQTLTRTNVLQEASASPHGTGAFVTAAFTPNDNSLLYVAVWAIEQSNSGFTASDLTLTDSETSAWTQQELTASEPGYSYGSAVWTTEITTGVSMTLTVDAGAADINNYRVEVYDFTDYDTTTPVGSTVTGNDADGDGALTITLPAAPASTSIVMAHSNNPLANPSNPSIGEGTGWTELFDVEVNNWASYGSMTRGGSTDTAVTWDDLLLSGNSFGGAATLAVEVQEAAAGGSAVPIIHQQHD